MSLISSIEFYFLNRLYGHTVALLENALESQPNNVLFRFWKSIARVFDGSLTEASRDLNRLRSDPSLSFSTLSALLYVNSQSFFTDDKTINELEEACDDAESEAKTPDLLNAARFYWLTNQSQKARDIILRVFKRSPDSVSADAYILRGWLEYHLALKSSGDKQRDRLKKAVKAFRHATKLEDLNSSARLGQAHCLLLAGSPLSSVLSPLSPLLNQQFSESLRVVYEFKLISHAVTNDWESVINVAESASRQGSLIATEAALVCLLGKTGNTFDIETFSKYVVHLCRLLIQKENLNVVLISDIFLAIHAIARSLEFSDKYSKFSSDVVSEVSHYICLFQKLIAQLVLWSTYLIECREFSSAADVVKVVLEKLNQQQLALIEMIDRGDDDFVSTEIELLLFRAHLLSIEVSIKSNELKKAREQSNLMEEILSTFSFESVDRSEYLSECNLLLKAKSSWLSLLLDGNLKRNNVIRVISEGIFGSVLPMLKNCKYHLLSSLLYKNLTFFIDVISAFLNILGPRSEYSSNSHSFAVRDFLNALISMFPKHPVLLTLHNRLTVILDPSQDTIINSTNEMDSIISLFEDPGPLYVQKALILANLLTYLRDQWITPNQMLFCSLKF
ncbi:hypothetical protein GEMRC1_006159 [Eukaryota sp. GEM-RC1]